MFLPDPDLHPHFNGIFPDPSNKFHGDPFSFCLINKPTNGQGWKANLFGGGNYGM